ncbi:hypothetical protein HLK59_32290 [Streptomyces sp. S3(2020)]|uniref:hypothetical protein n=1 Tax=Streptomyces sp. S3(2020) TaxID=2732044 RepID=UPI001488679A|nr:hypothetical protein [Streptomyces sp. S3(2020)]NNN34962.1 hypothetical protein [Streptomyces sp. S3(2020)]
MGDDGHARVLREQWDWLASAARADDAAARRGPSWVPPLAEELVLAARESPLRRWYPYLSHNCLRFEDGLPFWEPGGGHGREVPGSISYDTGGPGASAVFRVWRGRLLRTPDPVLVLTTPDAVTAVGTLVRVLERVPGLPKSVQ